MAYVVNNSRGQIVAVVEDGTINTSATSITLVGKSYTPYGEPIAENFVYMLENFADDTPPSTPIAGQLWWDIDNNALNAYTGNTWAPVSGITVDDTPPVVDVGVGDMWFDTDVQRLKVYSDLGQSEYAWVDVNAIAALATAPVSGVTGELYFNTLSQQLFVRSDNSWLLVGPENVAGFGETKWTSTSLKDTYQTPQPVILGTVNSEVIGIVAESSFTILDTERPTGFVNLVRGLNMSDSSAVAGYFIGEVTGNVSGTATNVTGIVSSFNGGTGQSSYERGQVLVGNVAGMLAKANITGNGAITVTPSDLNDDLIISYTGGTGVGNVTSVGLTAGQGIAVSGGPITTSGTIQVTNTGVTSITGGAGIVASQSNGAVTLFTNIIGDSPINVTSGVGNSLFISYTGGTGVGNVTSVGLTAGPGISVSGGPITTNGNITVNNTGVTSITAGNGISVNQSNGNVTVSSTLSIPAGVIVMWAGSNFNVPVGWALCDGTNGTPDLRNRFIIASGGSFNTGDIGGSFNLNATTNAAGSHDHGGQTATHVLTIDEIPSHNHSINNAVGATQTVSGTTNHQAYNTTQKITETGYTGGGQGHSHQILANGTHTHSVTGTYTPPYYSLAYIMKLPG